MEYVPGIVVILAGIGYLVYDIVTCIRARRDRRRFLYAMALRMVQAGEAHGVALMAEPELKDLRRAVDEIEREDLEGIL